MRQRKEEIGQSSLEYVEFETTARYPRGAEEWIYKRSSLMFLGWKKISKRHLMNLQIGWLFKTVISISNTTGYHQFS